MKLLTVVLTGLTILTTQASTAHAEIIQEPDHELCKAMIADVGAAAKKSGALSSALKVAKHLQSAQEMTHQEVVALSRRYQSAEHRYQYTLKRAQDICSRNLY